MEIPSIPQQEIASMSTQVQFSLPLASEKKNICSVCNSSFKKLSDLERHAARHGIGKDYFCEICSRSFRHKSSYSKHMKNYVHRTPDIKCKHCGAAFYSYATFNAHTKDCSYPRKCSCGAEFSDFEDYSLHLAFHSIDSSQPLSHGMQGDSIFQERCLSHLESEHYQPLRAEKSLNQLETYSLETISEPGRSVPGEVASISDKDANTQPYKFQLGHHTASDYNAMPMNLSQYTVDVPVHQNRHGK